MKSPTDPTIIENVKLAKSIRRVRSEASGTKLNKMLLTNEFLLISRKKWKQLFFPSCLIPCLN